MASIKNSTTFFIETSASAAGPTHAACGGAEAQAAAEAGRVGSPHILDSDCQATIDSSSSSSGLAGSGGGGYTLAYRAFDLILLPSLFLFKGSTPKSKRDVHVEVNIYIETVPCGCCSLCLRMWPDAISCKLAHVSWL